MANAVRTDVVVVGGGPAGATVGTLLHKYAPDLSVLILERERFPRDHVGESQLPWVSDVLDEMEVWDQVEAAGFPIKIGATYRWGTSDDLWDFEFVPGSAFEDAPRPARYEGQRRQTAFQVDRARYDQILLDHAESKGCEVRQGTRVVRVETDGQRVEGLLLEDGTSVRARYYVDASGHTGVVRRALGVETDSPTNLQNIAIWDYWSDADWAVSLGTGGTRVQVMSLGYGWIWFIPITPTRTSVGLVVPAEYYKRSGKRPADLYREALAEEPLISRLLANAASEDKLATTKDWSFLARQTAGENWFLAGESAGFADPILAAGMTLAHQAGREVAYAIAEAERGDIGLKRLMRAYDETQRQRIGQHIHFADYWYTANAHFSDLKEFTREIARDAGFDLDANAAFQWLGTGGFVAPDIPVPMFAGFTVNAVKEIAQMIGDTSVRSLMDGSDTLALDLEGATETQVPVFYRGGVRMHRALERAGRRLPVRGVYEFALELLSREQRVPRVDALMKAWLAQTGPGDHDAEVATVYQTIEAMIADGWVKATYSGRGPSVSVPIPLESETVHRNTDNPVVERREVALT